MEEPLTKAVIFCGGVGTRMWPMSRRDFPKQFQQIIGNESMFQSTLRRVLMGFKPEDIYISTGTEYLDFVYKQAPQIPYGNVIGEPVRRDTLAAVGLTTFMIQHAFPTATIAAIWGADHIVKNENEFDQTIRDAAIYSREHNLLVKVDVRPTFPSEHNGWVKIGKKIDTIGKHDIYEFEKFIEKPNEQRARELFQSHDYLINTGYLVWPAKLMVDFFRKYQSETSEILDQVVSSLGSTDQVSKIKELYPKIQKLSIDYGIFEHLTSKDTVVIPADLGWIDIGTWELLYEGLAQDPKESNVTQGNVELIDTQRTLVLSTVPDKLISVIGLKDVVVVDTKDGLVVCGLQHTNKVKDLVEKLKIDEKLIKFT